MQPTTLREGAGEEGEGAGESVLHLPEQAEGAREFVERRLADEH
jgi:hypothetical protein